MSSRAERREGMTCPRCDIPTGNNTQGHYWSWCQSTRRMEEFHFCCPSGCDRNPSMVTWHCQWLGCDYGTYLWPSQLVEIATQHVTRTHLTPLGVRP